ncbi:uncharacterized protein LOC122254197 isoform X3 [Penaeus japonicus]|uniref:uncharacterized protein LOC122254197 isoform X3 n=1 Tax=Penaeus japonicus TaxID=27405 RepID=UPI001C711F9B|nr:uncharacterized protein LOC122254197 isoform X3 [Penaeus japonicus]
MDDKLCEKQSTAQTSEQRPNVDSKSESVHEDYIMNLGNARNEDLDSEGHSKDLETEEERKDPQNVEHSQNLENKGYSQDLETEEERKDPQNVEHSQNLENKGYSQDLETEEEGKYPQNVEQIQDLENKGYIQDLETEEEGKYPQNVEQIQDLEDKGYIQDLETEEERKDPQNVEDSQNLENKGYSQDLDNAGQKNEEENTDTKNEVEWTVPENEEDCMGLNFEEENTDPQKEEEITNLKSEEEINQVNEEICSRLKLQEYQSDLKNEDNADSKYEKDVTDLKKEEQISEITDPENKGENMVLKNEEENTDLKNEEESTDPKKEEEDTEPKNEDDSTDQKKKEENTDLKNEEETTDLKNEEKCSDLENEEENVDLMNKGEGTYLKNEEECTDPEIKKCNTDLQNKEENIGLKEKENTDLKNEEETTDLKNEEETTDLKNEEDRTDPKNEEGITNLKNEEEITNPKDEEEGTDPMNEVEGTDLKDNECNIESKNEEENICQESTDLMNEEEIIDLKNEEENRDPMTECKTDLKNKEESTSPENEEENTGLKNEEESTDPKKEEEDTEPKNEDDSTDQKKKEENTDLKNEEECTNLKNVKENMCLKNEEKSSDPENEVENADPMNKGEGTYLKNEEECTDPETEKCNTDPQNEEENIGLKEKENTDLKNEEETTDLKNEEDSTDPIDDEEDTGLKNEKENAEPENEVEGLKNEAEGTDPKIEDENLNNEEESTDLKNEEGITDPENEEEYLGLKNEEENTDLKNEVEWTFLEIGEEYIGLKNEVEDRDPENEEGSTDSKNEEESTDAKNEEESTDPESEEEMLIEEDDEEGWRKSEDHEYCEKKATMRDKEGKQNRTILTPKRGKMSGKSKCILTENGVLDLYSQNLQHSINVQVIFVSTSDVTSYLRLSDGKHVSPVVLLVKKDGKLGFGVGAVLTIHDVAMHLAPGKSDKNEKDNDLIEVGFNQVIIKKYNILQTQSSVGKILGSLDQSATYRDAIKHVQELLRRNDSKFEAYIKFDSKTCKQLMAEGEKAREKGNYYFNKKDYNQAIIHYDIAKKKDAYDHRVWSNCSQALFKVGQYAYAESDALIAIKLNPFHMKAYYRAGQAATKLFRKASAEVYARSGIFACGSSPELMQLLEETVHSSIKAKLEIAASSITSTSISVTNKLEQETPKIPPNIPCTYKVTKGMHADIVELTIHDKCDHHKTGTKKCKHEKGLKENGVHITEIGQLEEDILSEVQDFLDKSEDVENNKQKANSNEKERKAEEKRRNKVEEIGRLEEKSFTNEYFFEGLRRARREYEHKNFMEATILFQQCLDVYSLENRCSAAEPHYEQTLQFLVAAAAIQGEPDQPLEAIKIMEALLKHSSIFRNSPAVYYFLAVAYRKKFVYQCRNRKDKADTFTIIACSQSYQLSQQYSKKCSAAICEQKEVPSVKWPGSNDPIEDTMLPILKSRYEDHMKDMDTLVVRRPRKSSSQESDNKTSTSNITADEGSANINNKNKTSMARSTPVSRCRFKDCISTQGHENATEEIYATDPEFKGYLEVTCEESCIISYHPCCWKAHKECQEDRVGKLSDKDFLGTNCITPDCTGKISSIHIYDETGNLKIELCNKKDKKNAQNSVKQKKKKDKKKEKAQANKNAEKKKTKHESVSEDTANTEKTQGRSETETEKTKPVNNNETNSDKKKTPASAPNLPIDPESLESSQVIVLKPMTEREELTETKNSKKNKKKKKNKKNKAIQPDLLGDPLECEQNNQSEYVARLKALKQQREALENDSMPLLKVPLAIPTRETPSEKVLEWLDPDNPFYLPEHLRDNPKALESVLQSKMSANSSVSSLVSGIPPESITVLLDFMYDWLKSEGPMSITDARIRQCVEENFPPEANTHVAQCGGIKQFLLQSINFAMIDEVICVRDHVVRAQNMIRKSVMERMNSSRYLISDGRRAKKFTHLLDDTKSSCSSSSSASHVAGSGVSYASTGLSGTTTSSVKLGNGEMNNNSKNSCKSVRSSFTSGLDDFDTDIPAVRPKLNPTAPEFEPRSNDEEEEEFSNEVCSEDEEENGKSSSSKDLRTSKPSECESSHDPQGVATQDGDELFQSDEEDDYDGDEEGQYMESLENQLQQKQEHIQVLNDRLYQMKTQMGLEISKLKQQVQDIKEEKRAIQTEKESISAQRENEAKKMRSELSRLQEEMKGIQNRTQSLENKCERSNDRANEFEAKLMEEQEVTAQLREEIRNLQESLTNSSRRAHEAEVKYLCTKKDLVEAHLTRTISRLMEEASLMRLLHQTATEDTKPDRAILSRSIVAWDDSIKSLRDRKRVFVEEALRLLGIVNQGRPLNALPHGDLDVPAIPDMSIAPLLMAQQKMSNKQMPKLPIGEQVVNRAGNSSSSSPQPVSVQPGSKALLPTPIGPPLHMVTTPTALDTRPLYLHNGVNPLAFSGGAIPKRATPAQPSTTPDLSGAQKWPDSHQLFVGQLPWEFNEGDVKNLFSHCYGEVVSATLYDKGRTPEGKPIPKCGLVTFRYVEDCKKALSVGPITVGNHTLNVQAKETKKPTKPPSLAVGSLASTVGEPATVSSHSAYGLSDISLNASAEASKTAVGPLPSPILHPPSTTTVTKPKFQNLTSNNSVGAIGTPPPKLVRPLPRQPPNAVKSAIPNTSSKDDSVTSTASYKRLIEICKQRVGKEYSSPDVCSALREVRIQNNKSLSGLNVDMIVERVKTHLKSRRPGSGQATLAPWASLTQCPKSGNSGPEWQGPGGEEGSAPEEQCSICLEALNACPTVPLQCQHVFHEKCIKDWLKRQSNCPNCRTFALMTDEYPSLTHS